MDSKNLFSVVDRTAEFDAQDSQDNKVMNILAYIGILVLIPLLAAKDSKFARFHCNQGLVLFIAELIISIVLGILGAIPKIGWIFGIIGSLVGICFLVLVIIGIINAVNGKAKELPLVGKFKILK